MSRTKSQATIEREAERAIRRQRRELRRAECERRRAEREARRARHALAISRPTPRVSVPLGYATDSGPGRYTCACSRCRTFFRSPDWSDDLCPACRVDEPADQPGPFASLEFADIEISSPVLRRARERIEREATPDQADPGPLFQR